MHSKLDGKIFNWLIFSYNIPENGYFFINFLWIFFFKSDCVKVKSTPRLILKDPTYEMMIMWGRWNDGSFTWKQNFCDSFPHLWILRVVTAIDCELGIVTNEDNPCCSVISLTWAQEASINRCFLCVHWTDQKKKSNKQWLHSFLPNTVCGLPTCPL